MKSWIPGVVGLGILLLFIGVVYGVYAEDQDAMETASAVEDVGVFLTGIGLILGALVDEGEDKIVRLGMLIAAALIIGLIW
ncbi:MAG TPA: hypothetical protein ENL42_03800 [Thermoplasmatales archaeon]|nr:hypothetical protein [Thermoplasmatales archaeon]